MSERNRRRRLLARRLKLSPKVTDAGKVCHSIPLTGNRGKVTPHPTSGGVSATFPQGGEGILLQIFLSSFVITFGSMPKYSTAPTMMMRMTDKMPNGPAAALMASTCSAVAVAAVRP